MRWLSLGDLDHLIGSGNLITQGTAIAEERYRSDVSVLLMGNGADEQLAGYGRHRTRFTRGGWRGLQEELEKDTQRLWTRNLGTAESCPTARHPTLNNSLTLHRQSSIATPHFLILHGTTHACLTLDAQGGTIVSCRSSAGRCASRSSRSR